VGGETVSEGVATYALIDPGQLGGSSYGFLQRARAEVLPASHARTRVGGQNVRGEDVLPSPFTIGTGVFALKGVGEVDRAVPSFQVLLMDSFDPL